MNEPERGQQQRRTGESAQPNDMRQPSGRAQGDMRQQDQRTTSPSQAQGQPPGTSPNRAQRDQQQRTQQGQSQEQQQRMQQGQSQQPQGSQDSRSLSQGQNPAQQNPNALSQGQNAPGNQQQGAATRNDFNVQGQLNVAPDRAARIHDTLIRSGERTNVRVDVNIGRSLPQTVRVRPLPPDLISFSPELRGYDYTVVEDDIVIVEPRSKRVVEVISPGGGRMGGQAMRGAAGGVAGAAAGAAGGEMATGSIQSGGAGASITLSSTDRQRIREEIFNDSRQARLDISTGAQLPTTIQVSALPDNVVSAVPALRGYQYFVTGERIVLVDPNSRSIVDVVQ
ncbi:DUF1236 domain-containing protein [Terrarubrum flagellatum]|uniref:DUF1236 domain-containing protein n=1 Tax=Terrirubrum flagellatum TaxID=2895980 RepID=UPI0031450C90